MDLAPLSSIRYRLSLPESQGLVTSEGNSLALSPEKRRRFPPVLSFGSDWPGTNAAWYPAKPLLGIYAAATRQTLDGEPPEGWFPEQRVDVETSIRAYTINNAFAAGEEDLKGSIKVGKLADFTVVDRDLLAIDPAEIKDVSVLATIVGGRMVYASPQLAGYQEQIQLTAAR